MKWISLAKIALFSLLPTLFIAQEAALAGPHPESDAMRQFVKWESENNPGVQAFDQELFDIPHIEIPIEDAGRFHVLSEFQDWFGEEAIRKGPDAMIVDFAEYLPSEIKHGLIFEKDGKKHLRYLLSPDDTKYGERIKTQLKSLGVNYSEGSFYKGRRTASRSIIAIDPSNGHSFSFKPSTNRVPHGKWNDDRVFPIRWAHLNRRLSDYFKRMEPELHTLKIAHEAAVAGFAPVNSETGDMAFSIRLMEEVSRNEAQHLSGFVLTDPQEVKRLAEAAGMTADEFLGEIGKADGRAMAELIAVLGFQYGSAHTQNIRYELGLDGKPTGKVVLLDLSDGRPLRQVFERNGQAELLEQWQQMVQRTNPVQDYTQFRRITFMDHYLKNDVFLKNSQDSFKERLSQITGTLIDEIDEVLRSQYKNVRELDEVLQYRPPMNSGLGTAKNCAQSLTRLLSN